MGCTSPPASATAGLHGVLKTKFLLADLTAQILTQGSAKNEWKAAVVTAGGVGLLWLVSASSHVKVQMATLRKSGGGQVWGLMICI